MLRDSLAELRGQVDGRAALECEGIARGNSGYALQEKPNLLDVAGIKIDRSGRGIGQGLSHILFPGIRLVLNPGQITWMDKLVQAHELPENVRADFLIVIMRLRKGPHLTRQIERSQLRGNPLHGLGQAVLVCSQDAHN